MTKTEIYCAYDELWPIESVKPNPRNPNIHPPAQVELLARIIRERGWRAPITVSDRSGLVVKGHGRLMAARLLKLDEVPIDIQHYENEAAEIQDMVADNKLAELSVTDDEALLELVEDLAGLVGDFEELELTGLSKKELEKLVKELESDAEQGASPNIPDSEGFEEIDETALEHRCPKCGFEF